MRGIELRSAIHALVAVILAMLATVPAGVADASDVRLFARVPSPGLPEGIAVDAEGTIYVGTSPKQGGVVAEGPPSKVFGFDGAGRLRREFTISGQDLADPGYGLYGMAFDQADRLYIVDAKPARIIRLDPRTGVQVDYTRFPDVPPCRLVDAGTECSETTGDLAAFPNYPVFAPDGTMYVTDVQQALIWKVPAGGGEPTVWFSDPGLESIFGPNGIQFRADGKTLLLAVSFQSNPAAQPQRSAGLYELPVRSDGSPGELRQFWQSKPDDGSDGFALARSGNVYVALGGPSANAVARISPAGQELDRSPPSPAQNLLLEVPFDMPASAAFQGDRVLVTNHAFASRDPNHFAVLEVDANEPGLPLFRPTIGTAHPQPAGGRRRCRGRLRPTFTGGRSDERFRGTGRAESISMRAGSDSVRAAGRGDCVRGGGGADRLKGNRGADRLRGGGGRDRLRGGRGGDRLSGGRGSDVLRGGPGRDILDCGPGRDRVIDADGDVVRHCELGSRQPRR